MVVLARVVLRGNKRIPDLCVGLVEGEIDVVSFSGAVVGDNTAC